ncbi:MAG: RICIN domain-containing protein, partial [Burkholderiaceae bacterium]
NCLTIQSNGSGAQATNDGASIVSAACDFPGSSSNSWTMDVALPIKYLQTSKCLDVRGGVQATADGTLIEQWSCTGLSNQLWTIKDAGNSQYQFVASNSGKCMDLVGGGTGVGNGIQQSQCSNTPTQLWTTENIGRGYTMVKSVAASANCLDVTGGSSATDGAYAQLTKCTTNELWTIGTPAPFP